MMYRKALSILIILITTISVETEAQRILFPDVLDLRTTALKPRAIEHSVFSDLGAWHAYALPGRARDNGAFIGPLLMDMHGQWLGNTFCKLHLAENGRQLDLSKAKSEIHYYPGLLQQQLEIDGLSVLLQLIFISQREALIRTSITNTTGEDRAIIPSYAGQAFNTGGEMAVENGKLEMRFGKERQLFRIQFPADKKWMIIAEDSSWFAAGPELRVGRGATVSWTRIEAFYPDAATAPRQHMIPDFTSSLHTNQQRWDAYLNRYLTSAPALNGPEKQLAVKAIVTLITNWRSASRDLLHDGVFPSVNYQGFYGVWSWDSWKQAAGLALIEPQIARDNIRCMFDYQDSAGMVPDCIYSNKAGNNLRDTKPPLAAWGVMEVYKRSPDRAFLEEIYPRLVRYHQWWYANRDHNKNGLCEFGSTDGTRIAAAWESGMDNAVRFDSAVMLQNNPAAWSLDQESVDLNAYLYREKLFLSEIAGLLNRKKEAMQWKREAAALKPKINKAFYDKAGGFYYDKRMDRPGYIAVDGPEGWIPLWAGICNKQQAAAVQRKINNGDIFNTFVPMPTLSAGHPAFDPLKGYWRGPVWLDQFNFGIDGLKRYGYNVPAKELVNRLLQNAEGLLGNAPICENYHPLTGKGLNARNFSWSSAHLLLLLKSR